MDDTTNVNDISADASDNGASEMEVTPQSADTTPQGADADLDTDDRAGEADAKQEANSNKGKKERASASDEADARFRKFQSETDRAMAALRAENQRLLAQIESRAVDEEQQFLQSLENADPEVAAQGYKQYVEQQRADKQRRAQWSQFVTGVQNTGWEMITRAGFNQQTPGVMELWNKAMANPQTALREISANVIKMQGERIAQLEKDNDKAVKQAVAQALREAGVASTSKSNGGGGGLNAKLAEAERRAEAREPGAYAEWRRLQDEANLTKK